jgi:hypothetical protein
MPVICDDNREVARFAAGIRRITTYMKRRYRVSHESDCTNSRMSLASVDSIGRIRTIDPPGAHHMFETGAGMTRGGVSINCFSRWRPAVSGVCSQRWRQRSDHLEDRRALEIAWNEVGEVGGYSGTDPRLIGQDRISDPRKRVRQKAAADKALGIGRDRPGRCAKAIWQGKSQHIWQKTPGVSQVVVATDLAYDPVGKSAPIHVRQTQWS